MSSSKVKTSSKGDQKVLSIAEQNSLIAEEIQRFIKLYRDKGALMVEEVNDLLPAEIIAAEVLDHFMQALEVNGVVITDMSENKTSDEDDEGLLLEDAMKDKENYAAN